MPLPECWRSIAIELPGDGLLDQCQHLVAALDGEGDKPVIHAGQASVMRFREREQIGVGGLCMA